MDGKNDSTTIEPSIYQHIYHIISLQDVVMSFDHLIGNAHLSRARKRQQRWNRATLLVLCILYFILIIVTRFLREFGFILQTIFPGLLIAVLAFILGLFCVVVSHFTICSHAYVEYLWTMPCRRRSWPDYFLYS